MRTYAVVLAVLLVLAGAVRAEAPCGADALLNPAGAGESIRPLTADAQPSRAFVRDFASTGGWLAGAAVDEPDLRAFRAWVRAQVDPDPIGLLKRQRAIFAEHGFDDHLPRYDKIIAGTLGRIRPMTRLEAALLAVQHREFGREGEFQANVLTRGGALRVYFAGSPEWAAVTSAEIDRLVAQDVAAGWTLEHHLHNHPFLFGNSTGDIAGTLIASGDAGGGDVAVFRRMAATVGLRRATITNGFQTIQFEAAEFGNFKRLAERPLARHPLHLVEEAR